MLGKLFALLAAVQGPPTSIIEDEDGLGYFAVPTAEAKCPDTIPEWVEAAA